MRSFLNSVIDHVIAVSIACGWFAAASPAQIVRPSVNAVVSEPETVYRARDGLGLRDHTLVIRPKSWHLFVLIVDAEGTPSLERSTSTDGGKSWSKPAPVDVALRPRTGWVQGFDQGGKIFLVLATDPSLPPQTPRISHFNGKKYEGIPGWITVARLSADASIVEKTHAARLENPGRTIYSHSVFRESVRLLGAGDRLTVLATTRFPTFLEGKPTSVWSIVSLHSPDGGDTFEAPAFMRKAFRGLRMLRPACLLEDQKLHLIFGDRYERKIVHVASETGREWKPVESNLNALNRWNFWYDGFEDARRLVLTDTQPLASGEKGAATRFGIDEYESTDRGQQWSKTRTIDLGLDQAYSALTLHAGDRRAHLLVGTGIVALTGDDGKQWSRADLPEAFRSGRPAIASGAGLLVLKAFAKEDGEPARIRMVRVGR